MPYLWLSSCVMEAATIATFWAGMLSIPLPIKVHTPRGVLPKTKQPPLQGYLAHKNTPPAWDNHMPLDIVLLWGPRRGLPLLKSIPLLWLSSVLMKAAIIATFWAGMLSIPPLPFKVQLVHSSCGQDTIVHYQSPQGCSAHKKQPSSAGPP